MAKRVWGYMAMCCGIDGHTSFWYKRYTPMETEIDGMKIWYIQEDPNDPTAGFNITDANSGVKICTAECTEINDIPKKIHKNLEIVKAKITDPNYADYRERCEWVADLMKFVSHFEGPNKGNSTTPPEEIDYSTVFETWSVKNVYNINQKIV